MRLIDADRLIDDIKKHNNVSEMKPTWRTKDVITLLEECPHTLPPNDPLSLEELREMVGGWVWVVISYEYGGEYTGWAFIPTPSCVAYLDQIIPIRLCGQKFVAYRRKPEKATS